MRNEYPRPELQRENWLSLNGEWSFRFADEDAQRSIQVPFVYQSKLSGINDARICDEVIYSRDFMVPQEWHGEQVLLHFGAVDYRCSVYINGNCAGFHEGGHTPFTLDITPFLTWESENIILKVQDPHDDETIPRGKQFWGGKPQFIWYTQSTGIWQSVWLEPVNKVRFEWIHFTPDIDRGTVQISYKVTNSGHIPVKTIWKVFLKDTLVCEYQITAQEKESSFTIDIFGNHILKGSFHGDGLCWSPESPTLFDVEAALLVDGKETDKLNAYFGMRKIHVENNRLYLNNRPYYQKLILDQGYWPDGLLTAPDDQAFVDDILKSKEMGFNGCRKHEKPEDPRFLYWADKLGFLVWSSMASFCSYSPDANTRFIREWQDVIQRDYNHPCIVVWEMLNESWGVPQVYHDRMQQHYSQALYHMAHSLDSSRLVVSNDGWEITESDICAIHSYRHGGNSEVELQETFKESMSTWEGLSSGDILHHFPYAKGFSHQGQPVFLTEFGGMSNDKNSNGWGYTNTDSEDDFLKTYSRLMDAIYKSNVVYGFCYTQLTDVQQEVNGLLTEDRAYKFDPKAICEINNRYHRL